jgi:hypothetical protein
VTSVPFELVLAVFVVLSAAAYNVMTQRRLSRAARVQQDILERGAEVRGCIVAINRPLFAGGTAEVYFTFDTAHGPELHSCAITPGTLRESIPAIGTPITIRYLPEDPAQALIPQLVRR